MDSRSALGKPQQPTAQLWQMQPHQLHSRYRQMLLLQWLGPKQRRKHSSSHHNG
jgi:hypothetical protein